MVTALAGDFHVCAVNTVRVLPIGTTSFTHGRYQVGAKRVLAISRIGTVATTKDSRPVAPDNVGITARIEDVPNVVDLMDLRRPNVCAPRGIAVLPDDFRFSLCQVPQV